MMALIVGWWQLPASVYQLLPADSLFVARPTARQADDLAHKSLANGTIEEIIKSVGGRAPLPEAASNIEGHLDGADERVARQARSHIIEVLSSQRHGESAGDDGEEAETPARRPPQRPLYYNPAQQQQQQQPTNMFGRQQTHKNLKPVHVSISQQTVNGLLSLLLLFIISTCGCIGTIFVISALTVIESLQTRGNCYLVSLALAQLLVNLFVIPSSALQIMAGEAGLNGHTLCHYQWLTLEFTLIVSQLSFALIAADNYLGYCCSDKVITRVSNFRQQHERAQPGREGAPSQLELEAGDNRTSSSHLAAAAGDSALRSGPPERWASEEERELERRRAERHAHLSLQRDFLGQSDGASGSGRDISAPVPNENAPPNLIRQFFKYSLKRPPEAARRSWAAGWGQFTGKPRLGSLLVARPSQATRQPQVGDYQLNHQTRTAAIREKPSNATRGLARQFASETPGAQLKRPALFNYRICCGRLRVVLWIVSIWSLAFAYIIHQHERSFTAKFCAITSTHYQPILSTSKRPALHRDSPNPHTFNLAPTPASGIALRPTPDDGFLGPTSGPNNFGEAGADSQAAERRRESGRLKRQVGPPELANDSDSTSVGVRTICKLRVIREKDYDVRSSGALQVVAQSGSKSGGGAAGGPPRVAHKTIGRNLASAGWRELQEYDSVSSRRHSNPLANAQWRPDDWPLNAALVASAQVDVEAAQHLCRRLAALNSSEMSVSRIVRNKRGHGLGVEAPTAHLDGLVLLQHARLPEFETTRVGHNNELEEFIIQVPSAGARRIGENDAAQLSIGDKPLRQPLQGHLEIGSAEFGRASRRGLPRITPVIDGSAGGGEKPHEGRRRDKISAERAPVRGRTRELARSPRPPAPLVWPPPRPGLHYFARQLGATWPASKLNGDEMLRAAHTTQVMLDSGSRGISSSAGRLATRPDAITGGRSLLSGPMGVERRRRRRRDKGASMGGDGGPGSMILGRDSGALAGSRPKEVSDRTDGHWQAVWPTHGRATAEPARLAAGLPIMANGHKMSPLSGRPPPAHRVGQVERKSARDTNKLDEQRQDRRMARAGPLKIGSIIPVYSQCDGGISCHRNSSTSGRASSPGEASRAAPGAASGGQHKVPTNDKWNHERLAEPLGPRRGSLAAPAHLDHDLSSTVHLNNDKQTSRPAVGPTRSADSGARVPDLASATKKRALMNNVGSASRLDAGSQHSNTPPAMQMDASPGSSAQSGAQIPRAGRPYDERATKVRAGRGLGSGPNRVVRADLAPNERRPRSVPMNNPLQPAISEPDGQRQVEAPAHKKDLFWPMLLGSIVLPGVLSSVLFLGAYLKMKEFKVRPYKPMPVNTVASTPPALLTPRSPIPLIAQRQVYAPDEPSGSSSKLGPPIQLTASSQSVGSSAQLKSARGGTTGANKLANEYASLKGDEVGGGGASSDSDAASGTSDCSSEHDDGALLARAAHATARRVSEATESMQASVKSGASNTGRAHERARQNSSSPAGASRRPLSSLRPKSKTIAGADDLTDGQRGAHANSHAQLNQVMSAPVNCASVASCAAHHIDERTLTPAAACHLPSSAPPLHATSLLGQVAANDAVRFRPFVQPNHRAISFSAPPSAAAAAGEPQPSDLGPCSIFGARQFTSHLGECEMSGPLGAADCAWPASTRKQRQRHSSPMPYFKPIQQHTGDAGAPLDQHHFDRRQQHAHSFHSGSSVGPRNPRPAPPATLLEQPPQPAWLVASYADEHPGQLADERQPLPALAGSLIERNQSLERQQSLPATRRLPLRRLPAAAATSQRAPLHSSLRAQHGDWAQARPLCAEQTHAGCSAHSSAIMRQALASVIRSVDQGDDIDGQQDVNSKKHQAEAGGGGGGGQANQAAPGARLEPLSRAHSRSAPSGSSGEMSGAASVTRSMELKRRAKPANLSHLIAVAQSQSAEASPLPLHRTRPSLVPLEQRDIAATTAANSKVILCAYAYMTDEQLLKSNMIVFTVNLALWAPFVALLMVLHHSDTIGVQFKDSVWWLAVLNCCSCSYIYALTNKDFREAFNKLFYYCCCKSHVTFQRKTPIFRRQLDVDQRGNMRVHIIPALNVYSNKLFAATSAPMASAPSPATKAASRSPLLPAEQLASCATIDDLSQQARLTHQRARGEFSRAAGGSELVPPKAANIH